MFCIMEQFRCHAKSDIDLSRKSQSWLSGINEVSKIGLISFCLYIQFRISRHCEEGPGVKTPARQAKFAPMASHEELEEAPKLSLDLLGSVLHGCDMQGRV